MREDKGLKRLTFFLALYGRMEGLVKRVSENQIIVAKTVNRSKDNPIFLFGISFFVIFKPFLQLKAVDSEPCFLAAIFFNNPFKFYRILSAVPNC